MALSADLPPAAPLDGAAPNDPTVASLYQDIILAHYRAPQHKGVLAAPTASVEQRNPLCGDVLTLHLRREGDTIVNAAFSARACSITQATASMLLTRIIGGSVSHAAELIRHVEALIEGASSSDADALGDLRALASLTRFPARKACVRLVTGALTQALTA
jgi:nitrogen fixation NifU-like protein